MKTDQLKVCMLPLEIKWGDKESNLSRLEEMMKLMHPETDLLVLPETFSTGFPSLAGKEDVRILAERNSGITMERIAGLASRFNVAIAGSFIADTGGLLFNRAFFAEPSGDLSFADKKHLFTMAGEHNVFSPGHSRLHIRFRGWEIAMVVCYDIRFPVWCRNRACGYDLLLAVANWPDLREYAWRQLLIARSIENQAYVCGVNCKGTDPLGFSYSGNADTFDFKGKPVTVSDKNGLSYALFDRNKLEAFRKKFPAWNDADDFRIVTD